MPKKVIITNKLDNVVVNIVDTAAEVENGLLVTDSNGEYIIGYYSECNKFEGVETADTIIPQKYTYSVSNGFVENPNYVEYVSPEVKISLLETQVATLQSSLIEAQNAINVLLGV